MENFVEDSPIGDFDRFMKDRGTNVSVGVKVEVSLGPNTSSYSLGGTSAYPDHLSFFEQRSQTLGLEKTTDTSKVAPEINVIFFITASNDDVAPDRDTSTSYSGEIGVNLGFFAVSKEVSTTGSMQYNAQAGFIRKHSSMKGTVKGTRTTTRRWNN